MMTFEQQKNTKALVWTAAVHTLLLLVFIFYKYTMPVQQPVEELGMEVNLGTSENGYGTDQPEVPEDPAPTEAAVAVNSASASEDAARDVHTTEAADAPVVRINRNKDKVKPKPTPIPVANNKPVRNNTPQTNSSAKPAAKPQVAKYAYQGGTGKGGNSAQNNKPGGSEGIGQGDDDMGPPGGNPGASNYTGSPGAGGGKDIVHGIDGRSLVSRPDPKAEFREGGKVVIRVTVNKEGTITASRVVSAANTTIRALALKKLQNVKFNKSTTAPAEQFGNITFNFRTTRK